MRRPGARQPRHASASGAFILLYHRIAEATSDPWDLCVSPHHFADHLDVLRRQARVLRLEQLYRTAGAERAAPDVAITFDDGYADNLHNARPLLERHDAPATVFVTTGYTGRDREFWWDELDRILLQPGELPAELELTIAGDMHRLVLGDAAHYSPAAARADRPWRAFASKPFGTRQAVYLSLWERLVTLPDAEQWRVLDQLAAAAGVQRIVRPSHRPLATAEIAALAGGGLIEIGAHSVTHPALPALPEAVQREEIGGSRIELERILASPIAGFSYPHGRHAPASVGMVRDAGFRFACAVRPPGRAPNLATGRCDPFLLPRVAVLDCDGDSFQRMLQHGFEN